MKTLGVLIGNPVSQSLSDITHNKILAKHGVQGCYEKRCLGEDELSQFMQKEIYRYLWVAVTMPFKERVLPYLDELSESVLSIGAVNTILIKNGKLIGYNTDWSGLYTAICRHIDPRDKKVLILGAGGVSKAAIYAMQQAGAQIEIFARRKEKADQLAEQMQIKAASEILPNYDLLIHATPVGMAPLVDQSLISKEQILPGAVIFDIVYNPPETKLLRMAKEIGSTALSGLLMFQELSLEQFQLVFGDRIDETLVREVFSFWLKTQVQLSK